jgi:hypothetical protein
MTRPPTVQEPADEFYVGYEPEMPPRMAGRVARVVAAAAALAGAGASVLLAAHHRLPPASFEFGQPRTVAGVLRTAPYPRLDIDGRVVWLVGPGKRGAEIALGGLPDGPVILRGTRAERQGQALLEVVPGATERDGTGSVPLGSGTKGGVGTTVVPEGADSAHPDVTLAGEIVDSKCFLGVMNPGEGTVHRDCARVCLRGGIPPMLLARGANGEETLLLLVDRAGRALDVSSLAGIPVVVTGRLSDDSGMSTLATDITAIQRR